MITLTEESSTYIKNKLLERKKGIGIRFGIEPAGCNGFSYKVEFVDEQLEDDLTFESFDVTVYTDPKSLVYLTGMTVDYATTSFSDGLEFNNPNISGGCGCGKSFTV
jgi:iron-sulfur cluster assembly protein